MGSPHPALVSTLLDALLEERAKVAVLAEALGIEPADLDSPVMREGLLPYIDDLKRRVAVDALARRIWPACS